MQDTRGRYDSEGKFLKVQPIDATDGYDTIEWLAKQWYSNGSVGVWGTSFAAHMEAGAAQLHPPSLTTIVVNMGDMSNAWDHGVRYRGNRAERHDARGLHDHDVLSHHRPLVSIVPVLALKTASMSHCAISISS